MHVLLLYNQAATVKELLQDHDKAGKVIGAICAAPIALKAHGIGLEKKITSYPSLQDKLEG